MKVAISGCQASGKSTMLMDIINKYQQFKTPNTTYRDAIKKHKIKYNKEADINGQTIIMNYLIDELLLHNKDENIIFDRCLFDSLIYTTWANLNSDCSDIDDVFTDLQYNLARYYAYDYDKIIFIPLMYDETDPKIENDEFRDIDPEYRIQIDLLFKGLYETLSEDPIMNDKIIYISGSRGERLKQFEDLIIGD